MRNLFKLLLAPLLTLAIICAPAAANRGYNGLVPQSGGWLGDSITLGVRTGVTANQVYAYLVSVSKGYYYGSQSNAGVAGNTSTQGLARIESVLALGPTMVEIQFGTNDPFNGVSVGAVGTPGTYMDNMAQMIVKAQRTGARVTIVVPPLILDSTADATVAPYRTAARSLATTYGCDTFDTYADEAALSPSQQTANKVPGETPNGIHWSATGNAWAAGLVGTTTANGNYVNSFKSSQAIIPANDNDLVDIAA